MGLVLEVPSMTLNDSTDHVLEHILSEGSIERMGEALDDKLTSRRGFMSQAAKIGGGATVLAGNGRRTLQSRRRKRHHDHVRRRWGSG